MGPSEPAEETDWELARRARDGDEDAYARLIARHQTPIHSFVYRSIGNEEMARDVTQEVFIRAWFALARVREQARFTTWLFQIAVNLCRDHAKSKSSRNARQTDSFTQDPGDGRPEEREFASGDRSPDLLAEQRETMTALEAEIQALPYELCAPFVLGAIEHQPYKEVAAVLGLTAKAVEVRIYRARRMLCENLTRHGFTAGGGLKFKESEGSYTQARYTSRFSSYTVRILYKPKKNQKTKKPKRT